MRTCGHVELMAWDHVRLCVSNGRLPIALEHQVQGFSHKGGLGLVLLHRKDSKLLTHGRIEVRGDSHLSLTARRRLRGAADGRCSLFLLRGRNKRWGLRRSLP